MVVDMLFVGMGADDKGMLAFQKAGGKFIAHLMRFRRRNLARLEGLAHLIGNHIVVLFPPGKLQILALGKQELCIYGVRVTGIGCHQLAAVRLVRVHAVIRPVLQRLRDRLALVGVHCDDAGRGHGPHSLLNQFLKQKTRDSSIGTIPRCAMWLYQYTLS